jgi:hypothetical protein
MWSRYRCLALSMLAAGAVLPAQKSDGPTMAVAHAMMFDTLTAVGAPGVIHWKGAGFDSVAPGVWAPAPLPGVPDFATLFGGLAVDVDGLSSGYDWVLSLSDGTASTQAGDWGAISFSVTRGTLGAANTRIAAEVASADGAAADLFAYVIPGSALPPDLVGVTFRAQDSTEVNAFVPGQKGNITAHDIFLSLLFRENPQLVPTLPLKSVFFTVTTAAAQSPLLAAWWNGTLPSGATILRTDWNGSNWTTPVPFLLPADLGLTSAEDVDALAVDVMRGRVLFSTTRQPGLPQHDPLLFARVGTQGNAIYHLPPSPLWPNGQPVSDAIGLAGGGGPDDVDGICSLDPSGGGGPTGLPLGMYLGTHQPPLLPVPNQLSSSVFRRFDAASGNEGFVTFMTGWPPPGTPSPGFAVVAFRVPSAASPYETGAFFLRPVGSPFDGHPERFDLLFPPYFSMLGIDVEFIWGAASADIDVTEPVRITL